MTYHNIQNQAAQREIQRLTAELAILLTNATATAQKSLETARLKISDRIVF